MRSRTAIPLWTVTLGMVCLWAVGCGSGEGEAPPPSKETLQRPSRLWPDVPEPPEPRQGVTGSLTAPAGETAGTETPAAGEAEGGGAAAGETSTGGTSTPGTAAPAAGGSAGAGLDALPAAVKQAASALSAKAPAIQAVAFDIAVTESGGPAAAGPPMPGPPQDGHVEAMPPDKMRIEGTGDMNGKPAKLLMIMNGSKTWIQASDPATGQTSQVIKMDLSAMPGAKASSGPMPFVSPRCDAVLGQMAKETTFESVSDSSLNNEVCKMFEGKGADGTTRVWFSQADGMIRRIQELDGAGSTTSDTRISNIQVNPSLAASRFDYTPPDGVPVMDMGELMKQMMQGMGEAMKEGMKSMGEAMQPGTSP